MKLTINKIKETIENRNTIIMSREITIEENDPGG